MSRSDQLIGLNQWASELVQQTRTIVEEGTRYELDGKPLDQFRREIQVPVAKVEVCGKYCGMFEDEYSLHRYTMPDGKVYQEYVQAQPWSSGPCFFLALEDEDGKGVPESFWSEEDINNA